MDVFGGGTNENGISQWKRMAKGRSGMDHLYDFFLGCLVFFYPGTALSDDEVKAPSAVLLEPQKPERCYYAKNADEPRPIACGPRS